MIEFYSDQIFRKVNTNLEHWIVVVKSMHLFFVQNQKIKNVNYYFNFFCNVFHTQSTTVQQIRISNTNKHNTIIDNNIK